MPEHNPQAHYRQTLYAIAHDLGDEERPLLLLLATSLARPWELLDAATVIRNGQLSIPAITYNNLRSIARVVALPATLQAEFGTAAGTVYDLLGLPANRRGRLIEVHRMALSELDLVSPTPLEGLLPLQLAALVESAPTPAHAHAALAAAGIAAQSVVAERIRADLTDEHHRWVADQTDRHLRAALALSAPKTAAAQRSS